jgi:hypothetical protein
LGPYQTWWVPRNASRLLLSLTKGSYSYAMQTSQSSFRMMTLSFSTNTSEKAFSLVRPNSQKIRRVSMLPRLGPDGSFLRTTTTLTSPNSLARIQPSRARPARSDGLPTDPVPEGVTSDGQQRSGGRYGMALFAHGGPRQAFPRPTFLRSSDSHTDNPWSYG